MKRLLLATLFVAGAAIAAQVNDLAPDFTNTIEDDGFWDTTGHLYVSVSEGSSDALTFGSLDSCGESSSSGSIALFDSREKTAERSPALPEFYSTKTGVVILVR